MDKNFPDNTDRERTSVGEKHKRLEQNLEIRRNKEWENLKKESKHRNQQR